jgi:hypothetical protein
MTNALFWLMVIGIAVLTAIALSFGGMNVTATGGPGRVLW